MDAKRQSDDGYIWAGITEAFGGVQWLVKRRSWPVHSAYLWSRRNGPVGSTKFIWWKICYPYNLTLTYLLSVWSWLISLHSPSPHFHISCMKLKMESWSL